MSSKKLGLFDSVLLVSGSMIGSGIFLVSADMTRQLGSAPWVMMAWVLAGVITLLAALHFGELASMMPGSGGQFNFISRIYGRKIGFVYGWTVFSVIQTGVIAAVAMAFSKHFWLIFDRYFVTDYVLLNHSVGTPVVALLSVWILTGINVVGVQETKWVQRVFTLTKFLALGALIVGGIYYAVQNGGELISNFNDNHQSPWISKSLVKNQWEYLSSLGFMLAFASAMVGSLFSSDAWQGITFMGSEIKDSFKTIPKALFWGTLLVTIVYCLANLAYFSVLTLDEVANADSDRVGVAAVGKIIASNGSFWSAEIIMAMLVLVSTFGCNNGLILSGSRLYQSMAEQGLFFKSVVKVNQRGVPQNALIYQAIWASVLCLSGTYGQLLSYCTFASLLFYIITVAGVIKLRKNEPIAERPYKVWFYPYSTYLYLILAGFVAIGILFSQFTIAITGIGIVLLGWPIYRFFGR
jgi:APA family basic amino acid/polyamine antiporter